MIVQDHYEVAIKNGYKSLVLVIEYLVNERKVLEMTDNEDKLTYYLQDRFKNKMNEYLKEYSERNEIQRSERGIKTVS